MVRIRCGRLRNEQSDKFKFINNIIIVCAEENVWCENSKSLVEKLTFGKVLQAQVYGYAEDGIPLIYLYTVVDDKVRLIINSKGFFFCPRRSRTEF